MNSNTRVADAISILAGRDGVRMLTGVTSGTAGNVSVGGAIFKVKHWVNRPTTNGAKVIILMQGGSVVAFGTTTVTTLMEDTGLLDVTSARGADWTEGSIYVRRVGSSVHVTSYGLACPDNLWFAPALEFPIPTGFTPALGQAWAIPAPTWDGDSGGALYSTFLMPTDDPARGWVGVFEYIGNTRVFGELTYLTDDPWPDVLPGTPVTTTLGRPRLGERGI